MKRSSLAAAVAVCLAGTTTPLHAQYDLGTPGFLGIAGGATLTELSSSNGSTPTRWGGMAGLLLGRRITQGVAALLEVNWAQQGGGDTRLEYVDVPLTAGTILRRGTLRFRPYLGVGLGFKSGCASPTPGLCNAASDEQWTLPLGFTLGSQTSPHGWLVGGDVRYAIPLSHALDNSAVYNRSWQFRLVLAKPLGRR